MSGTRALTRFMLRRERRGLPIWVVTVGLLFMIQSVQSQGYYGTPAELGALRATVAGNAALVATGGPLENLATVGGEVMFEVLAYLAVVAALMNVFLVGRHTRGDEEAGRTELIRAAQVSRRAPLLASLATAAIADAALGGLLVAVGIGTGLPVTGSVVLGLAMATTGLFWAALTALAAQVLETARGVYGAVAALVGVAYGLRAAGDVGDGTLSWLSPVGWVQRAFPYTQDRWWVVLVPLGAGAALAAGALVLLERRDLGAGLIASRPGPAGASWPLRSPLGLAWRLQRVGVVGWTTGGLAAGVVYGSLTESIQAFVDDNPDIAEFLPGGGEDVVDSYLAVTLSVVALLAAASGVVAMLRTRGEEASGRAETVLATATSRTRWAGAHLAVALAGSVLVLVAGGTGAGVAYAASTGDPGQVERLMVAALVHVPAAWVLVGVAALGVGLWPRAASAVAWTVFAVTAAVLLLGDSLRLPPWLTDLSPLAATPQAPFEDVSAGPLAVLLGIAALMVAVAARGLQRRDVRTG